MSYYTINEEAARTANDLNSHYTYREGSATASYRRQVDEATELAERQKKRVDPMYHEKIDRLLDLYCRKLAENLNDKYAIAARCPSMLVSGRANFPVQKKKKQNAAEERRLEEWKHIQGLLDKIRSVGTGGISSDDPQAVEKLEAKLAALEKHRLSGLRAPEQQRQYPAHPWPDRGTQETDREHPGGLGVRRGPGRGEHRGEPPPDHLRWETRRGHPNRTQGRGLPVGAVARRMAAAVDRQRHESRPPVEVHRAPGLNHLPKSYQKVGE